ncbi:MAG TPA: DUF3597 family protein, partial [Enterovirga sp.]
MSIFGSIMNKIFGASPASASTASTAGSSAPSGGQATSSATSASTASSAAASGPVDVEAVLTGMASKAGQTLDWR